MFVTTHKMRVRYAETDRMGYAYYGNYPTYLEVAREHWDCATQTSSQAALCSLYATCLFATEFRFATTSCLPSQPKFQACLRAAESTLSTKYTTSRQNSAPREKPPWFLLRPKQGAPPPFQWPFLRPWPLISRELPVFEYRLG